jgi:putative oxidoreductase
MKKLWLLLKKILTSEYLSFVFRIYIGWLFIYASLTKIPDPALFAENVAAYQIVPYWGINLVAVILPMLELVAGFFLILGLQTKAAASILGGLLLMYGLVSIATLLRGFSISCGCYDALGDPVDWKKVMTDLVYFFMMVQVFFFDRIYLFRKGWFAFKRESPNGTFASK